MPDFSADSYLSGDQKELLETLNGHGVDYVLIGAVAVAYHGYPRTSQDLDLFFNPTKQNTEKLFAALNQFFHDGFETELSYEEVLDGTTIRFGSGFQRTELLSEIDGVEYREVNKNKENFKTEERLEIPIIGYDELEKNKLATGRTKDRADIEELRKIHGASD